MSTVVLYCWCHSDSASVLLFFSLFYIVFIQDGNPPGCGTTTTEIGVPARGWCGFDGIRGSHMTTEWAMRNVMISPLLKRGDSCEIDGGRD